MPLSGLDSARPDKGFFADKFARFAYRFCFSAFNKRISCCMTNAIEIRNLSHSFGNGINIPDRLNMNVQTGSIYGFLGPNGAGKTTVLRLLLGLIAHREGNISILGEKLPAGRTAMLGRTGALIESPSFYGKLTATENLEVIRRFRRVPESRIAEALELTGLSDTGNKTAGKFSLGMKQRLGIAAALLHRPELLILDEPTNGLDPGGILAMRELLIRLNRERGITIVISSHLLAEIEKLVTHAGVLNSGKLLFEGQLEQLQQLRSKNTAAAAETSDNVRSAEIASRMGLNVRHEKDQLLIAGCERETLAQLNRELNNAGILVYSIAPAQQDLESVFLQLIGQ
jgi:ABC-type multidrug transport system ATPase subunit